MFCVFFQDIQSNEDSTILIIHNKSQYSFSRELSIKYSPTLANLINQNEENEINLDYFYEYDDFQLISDLFSFKRIFITKTNIDFLEFAANFFQIQILTDKTTKYKMQYNDFLKNPIFKKIKTLRNQIFSIFQSTNFSEEEEEEIDNNNNDDCNTNDNFDSKSNDDKDEIETQLNTNEKEKQVDSTKISELPTIQYDEEYSSTVSHLLFSACIFDPLNIDKYLQIISHDKLLLTNFIEAIRSNELCSQLCNFILEILRKMLEGTEDASLIKPQKKKYYGSKKLDTNLFQYFNDLSHFFRNLYSICQQNKYFVDIIKSDDVDEFQSKFASNPKIMNDFALYKSLFKISMITSSVKCFKYFLINWTPLFGQITVNKQMVQSSIIGGNIEIFRLTLEKYDGSAVDFIQDSIIFHKNEILRWIIENNCQFLSLYNTCCSRVLYGTKYITQKWYKCKKCYKRVGFGCCKFCAKHCHLNKNEDDDSHNVCFDYISSSCFCDDDCALSKNIELDGTKIFVEIDDLILLSIFSLNTSALKVLIEEGAYIVRCRDRTTKDSYSMMDKKLIELLSNLKGYKEKLVDELDENKKENQFNLQDFLRIDFNNFSDYSDTYTDIDTYEEEEEGEKEEREEEDS